MTRVYDLEKEEFERLSEGIQSFVILKNDKPGIKSGDKLIFQLVEEPEDTEESHKVHELEMKVDFFLIEGLKTGYVACQLTEINS